MTTRIKKVTGPAKTKRFEVLAGKDLTVDLTVQRLFDERQVRKLEANWDEMKIGVLIVSQRADGKHYVIDGWHRVTAGTRYDPAITFQCLVWEGLTLKDEAQTFRGLNRGRLEVNPFVDYKVGLVAEEPFALAMSEAVTEHGLAFGVSPSTNVVAAVKTCQRIVVKDGNSKELLSMTLGITQGAWGRTSEAWESMALGAVSAVLHRNRGVVDLDRLIKVLGKERLDWWKARAMPSHGGGSVSRGTALANLIIERYNVRLSKGRKIA